MTPLIELLRRLPSAETVTEDELATLKNNAADSLLRQSDIPSALLPCLREALQNPAHGLIWQEYAVQKLSDIALRGAEGQDREALALLEEQLARTDYVFAGSALLGLARVHRGSPQWVARGRVAQTARMIFDGDSFLTTNRSTALLVLAAHDPEGARTRALTILAQPESAIALQTAALGSLGMSASPEDQLLLFQHRDSPDIRLRTAARAALAKRFDSPIQ